MISLLTISCVYLGGTSVLPMAEAAIVDGQDVADGTTLNFTDNVVCISGGDIRAPDGRGGRK